jgi:hypothetical protein
MSTEHTATDCWRIYGSKIQYGNITLDAFRRGHKLPIPLIQDTVPMRTRENILINAKSINDGPHICMWVAVQCETVDESGKKIRIPGKFMYKWPDTEYHRHYYINLHGLTAGSTSDTILIQSFDDKTVWKIAEYMFPYFVQNQVRINFVEKYHDLRDEGDIYVSHPAFVDAFALMVQMINSPIYRKTSLNINDGLPSSLTGSPSSIKDIIQHDLLENIQEEEIQSEKISTGKRMVQFGDLPPIDLDALEIFPTLMA